MNQPRLLLTVVIFAMTFSACQLFIEESPAQFETTDPDGTVRYLPTSAPNQNRHIDSWHIDPIHINFNETPIYTILETEDEKGETYRYGVLSIDEYYFLTGRLTPYFDPVPYEFNFFTIGDEQYMGVYKLEEPTSEVTSTFIGRPEREGIILETIGVAFHPNGRSGISSLHNAVDQDWENVSYIKLTTGLEGVERQVITFEEPSSISPYFNHMQIPAEIFK